MNTRFSSYASRHRDGDSGSRRDNLQPGGVDRVYKEGESGVEVPNQVGQARNAGSVPARVMASYLLPQGAPLSTPRAGPMAPAALPKTGAADPWAPAAGWCSWP
jgi:hypothetical protein